MTRGCCANWYASRPTLRAIGRHKVVITRWLTTSTGVLCLRGVVLCVDKGLAKLHLCKSSGSHEASSNCKATEIANMICQYSFDE